MDEELRQKIGAFLENPNESPEAKAVVKWQWRLYGGFFAALFHAIALADDDNLTRLSKGFPIEVSGFMQWSQGDLATELRDKGVMD